MALKTFLEGEKAVRERNFFQGLEVRLPRLFRGDEIGQVKAWGIFALPSVCLRSSSACRGEA